MKELDRHKTIIRRQEKELDALNPDTEEVCLSARSFSENMVISLRDEAIEAKEKQIAILNGQNEKLLANLDSLESEIHNMQKDLLGKEKVIAKKQRYGEHLEHKIDKLERDLQKKGGEEAAIEVTNRQNAQLLQLLQVHETKTEELEAIKKDLEEQRKELEEQLKTAEKELEELYIKEDKAYVIRFKRIKDKERMVVVFRNQHDADMYADNIKKQGGQVFSNKLEKIPYKVVDKK